MSSRSQNLPAAALAAVWLAGFFILPLAVAQTPGAKVTVTVHNVTSDQGTLRGRLCTDPSAFGVSTCVDYAVDVPAKKGSMDLVFTGVKPGEYALTVFHDENDDGKTQVFSEPFAFGNETKSLPPIYEEALLKVTSDMTSSTTLFRIGQ